MADFINLRNTYGCHMKVLPTTIVFITNVKICHPPGLKLDPPRPGGGLPGRIFWICTCRLSTALIFLKTMIMIQLGKMMQ